jgi:hypothetical protein
MLILVKTMFFFNAISELIVKYCDMARKKIP